MAGNTDDMPKTTLPRIVITRPKGAAERFSSEILACRPNAKIISSPIISISFRDGVELPNTEALVFSSVHGVEAHVRLSGAKRQAYCVGELTAQKAREYGYDVVATGANAGELQELLGSASLSSVLRVRGAHVAGELSLPGGTLKDVVVYDQVTEPLSETARGAFRGERPVVLPLFSPRSASELAKQMDGGAPCFAAFMSAAVREAFQGVALEQTVVAEQPDGAAMLRATVELFDAACSLEGRTRGV